MLNDVARMDQGPLTETALFLSQMSERSKRSDIANNLRRIASVQVVA